MQEVLRGLRYGSHLRRAFRLLFLFYLILLNLFAVPLAGFLLLARIFFRIGIVRLVDIRIGHLSANTELFLRRIYLGKVPRLRYYAIVGKNPANKQLMRMISRKLRTVEFSQPKAVRWLLFTLSSYTLLRQAGLFYTLPFRIDEYEEFNSAPPQLSFTDKERERGGKLLKSMGVKGSYVCFHSRDSAYLEAIFRNKGSSYHDFRDCSVKHYLRAAEYLAGKGIYAIRMGSVVREPFPHGMNKRIVDYAARHRSDFGDIFLSGTCKFFLGSTAGLFDVATILGVPVAHANLIPLTLPPLRECDLFIPKKVWSAGKKRLLAFSEIIRLESDEKFSYSGSSGRFEFIENTPEEILELAIEMNDRLEGRWKPAPGDEALQHRYKSLFHKGTHCHGFPGKIGAAFIRKNRKLLG